MSPMDKFSKEARRESNPPTPHPARVVLPAVYYQLSQATTVGIVFLPRDTYTVKGAHYNY